MNSLRWMMLVVAASCLGCSRTVVLEQRPREVVVVKETKAPPGHVARRLGIPPGHLPRPGECRIWYPGVPPGRQPRPGSCGRLARQLPAGAWLIERSREHPELVRVSECHTKRPDMIVAVRIYEVSSGRYVRED